MYGIGRQELKNASQFVFLERRSGLTEQCSKVMQAQLPGATRSGALSTILHGLVATVGNFMFPSRLGNLTKLK